MSLPPQYRDEPASPTPASKPKGYGTTPLNQDGADAPLFGQSSSQANAWTHSPGADLPDDFKVGVAVIDCDAVIRLAFIRKVYSILFVQLLATTLVSLALSLPAAADFMHEHAWIIWIPMLGSFASLFGVYWKRHQHPANLILLGLFTLFEAVLVGTVVSYYESRIVSDIACLLGQNTDSRSCKPCSSPSASSSASLCSPSRPRLVERPLST
jgi:hypothetical protein